MNEPISSLRFGWPGARVRVETDDPALADLVARLWGVLPEDPDAPELRFALRSARRPPVLALPSGDVALDPDRPVTHAYNVLMVDLLARVRTHLVFHGTALVRDGRALLVSGPSGFGKSTTALHLALSGYRILAEDAVFVERGSGRILPFPRPLHVRPGTRATLAPADLAALERRVTAVHGDEWSVDAEPWRGGDGTERLAMVVLLRPAGDRGIRRMTRYEVEARQGREALLDEAAALPDVTAESDPARPGWRRFTADRPAALSEWLERRSADLFSINKLAAIDPTFTGRPHLAPIGPFQAALELSQEMFNRTPGSLVDREFRGREAALVMEVAGLLAGARCCALEPGDLAEQVRVIDDAFTGAGA